MDNFMVQVCSYNKQSYCKAQLVFQQYRVQYKHLS